MPPRAPDEVIAPERGRIRASLERIRAEMSQVQDVRHALEATEAEFDEQKLGAIRSTLEMAGQHLYKAEQATRDELAQVEMWLDRG